MDDLIRRQAAIDAAIKADMENNSNVLSEKRARVIDRHISAVPSAQPEKRTEKRTDKISETPTYTTTTLVDISNESINKIAEAVAKKMYQQEADVKYVIRCKEGAEE